MKKSIIAAGAASLALAAMPVVGVFAAPYTPANTSGTVTDTLTVNIPPACTIINNNSTTGGNTETQENPTLTNAYYVQMANGEYREGIGTAGDDDPNVSGNPGGAVSVSCNTGKGDGSAQDPASWVLTAVGAGAAGHVTDLWNSTAGEGIPAAAVSQESARATDATSGWSYKVTMGTVAEGEQAAYDTDYVPSGQAPTYKAITSSEVDIAKGSGDFSAGFTMNYAVFVDRDQTQGSYTGAVKYTLYNPAA